MAEGKSSFVLYTDQKEVFEALDDEKAGKLIKHIFRYVNDENPEADDPIVKAVFIGIQQALKRDLKKWENRQEQRRQAGLKSAEARKKAAEKAKEIEEKERMLTPVGSRQHPSTVNGNGNGNGNGNVSSKEDERETRAIEFLKTNAPTRYQTDFQMKYEKQIENLDKFVEDFNDTCDQEGLEFTDKILFARLGKYARNWIENQNKQNQKFQTTPTAGSYESGKLERF